MQVTILIVNWNAGPLLASCLRSVDRVLPADLRASCEVIIVDNGSTDGSAEALSLAPQDRLLRQQSNLGFGAACNRGAEQARGEFLLLLNPDCELRTGALERCLGELRRTDMRVGICGVALEDEHGSIARSCHRFPGLRQLLGAALGLHAVWPSLFDSRMNEWDHRRDRTVDHVIGAFFLMRLSTFRELSGFDERFFVYLEDLDLSLRARRAGWITRFVASPPAYHLGGGVSRQVKAHRLFYATRSRIRYGHKHFPRWQAWLHTVATLALEPVSRCLHAILRRSFADLKATARAFGMLYRDIGRWQW